MLVHAQAAGSRRLSTDGNVVPGPLPHHGAGGRDARCLARQQLPGFEHCPPLGAQCDGWKVLALASGKSGPDSPLAARGRGVPERYPLPQRERCCERQVIRG